MPNLNDFFKLNSLASQESIKIIDTAHEYLDNGLELTKSNEIDQFANYKIEVTKHLTHLDGYCAKAYACSNNSEIYCLVFDYGAMPRTNLIAYLKSHAIEQLLSPIDYGITTISLDHQEHLVVMMPLLPLMSLKDFLISKGPCTQDFAIKNVLVPLAKILQKFETIQVAHGKINLSNIFIDQEHNKVFLGECIADLPSYKQNGLYCALEIFDSLPIARGFNYIKADYYALGIVYLLLIMGNEKKLQSMIDQIMQARISLGSTGMMLDNVKISRSNKILLTALLSDKAHLRWGAKEILDWHDGNFSNIDEFWQTEKPMLFLEKECYNIRHLAYELQKNWDLAQKFIIENKISIWIERQLGNKELAEHLEVLSHNALKCNGSKTLMDEALIKFIAALDAYGPLRFKDCSVMIESVPVMLFYGFFLNKNNYLINAGKIIKGALWRVFESKFFDKKNPTYTKFINLLEKANKNYPIDILGFGPERCLYDLNPTASCQSPLLKGKIVTSVKALLQTLNHKLANNTLPITDRHISAFILSKLNISYETFIGSVANTNLTKNKELMMVIIFDQAQKSLTDAEDLKALIRACVVNLSFVVKSLHNKITKEAMITKLNSLVKDNSLASILAIVLNEKINSTDLEEFNAAKEKYASILHLRAKLMDKTRASEIGYRYGLKVCVIFSYIFCFLMFLFLLSSHI